MAAGQIQTIPLECLSHNLIKQTSQAGNTEMLDEWLQGFLRQL